MDEAREEPTRVEVTGDHDGCLTLMLVGEFDEFTSTPLAAVATTIVERPSVRLRIDASRVTFASSAMVGALIKLHRATTTGGGDVGFTAVSPTLARILEVTSLTELFHLPADGSR